MTERDKTIDIAKGIGIVLMVVGHSESPFTNFIYSFHMPLFFFLGGALFWDKYSDSIEGILTYFLKKIKSLWVPYFVTNTVFTLLTNYFIKINIYTNNPLIFNYWPTGHTTNTYSRKDILINILKGSLFFGGTEIAGPIWFIRTFFYVSIWYVVADYIVKKILPEYIEIIQIFISIFLFVLSLFIAKKHIYIFGFELVAETYIYFNIGRFYTCKVKSFCRNSDFKIISLLCSVFILFGISKYLTLSLSNFGGFNPIILIITSCIGIIMIYFAIYLLQSTKISKMLEYIGKHSIYVLCLHLLFFKLVSLIKVVLFNYPSFTIAMFPVINYGGNNWWIIYSLVGLILPLGTYEIINLVKKLSDMR